MFRMMLTLDQNKTTVISCMCSRSIQQTTSGTAISTIILLTKLRISIVARTNRSGVWQKVTGKLDGTKNKSNG